MSLKKAQKIVNELDDKFGINALGYQNSELEIIKDMLDNFLELGVETEDLQEPEDCELDIDDTEDEEDETEEL